MLLLLLAISNNGVFQGISLHNANATMVYERPMLYAILIAIAVLIWIGVQLTQKSFQIERRMIYSLFAFLLSLVYVVSSFNAESPFLAKYGIFTSLIAVLFFIAGTFLFQYERIVQILPGVYLVFGYCIVIYGLLNLLGNAYLQDSLSFIDGIRVTSIFQYANAYAVLLLTLWITILMEINRSHRLWVRIAHGAMLVPVCASFLLTLSRGALIVLPVLVIAVLLMFRIKQQLLMVVYSVIAMGLSLMIYTHLEEAGTKVFEQIQQARSQIMDFDTKSILSVPSITSWAYLFGISIIMSLIVYLVVKFVEPRLKRWEEKTHSIWVHKAVPLGILILFFVGAIAIMSDWFTQLLPEVLRSRVENVNFETHSVYERLTMYKDAFAIWGDYPIIGGGAGAWDAVYERYQSYPYLSAQTHGYITQLLVDIGLVGTIIYVGFIITILTVFIRYYGKAQELDRSKTTFYFIVPITLLIHSMIDFEMSYLFYYILVFLCLGVITGTQRQPVKSKIDKKGIAKVKWTGLIVVSILVLIIIIPNSRQLYAVNKFKQSNEQLAANASFDQIVQTLESGLDKSPKHPVLLYQISALYYQVFEQTRDAGYLVQSNHYMEKLNQYEPNYRQSVELRNAIALSRGNQDEAIRILLDGVKRYPFDASLYDLAAQVLLGRWEALRSTGAVSDVSLVANQIKELYQEMKAREQINSDLPDTVVLLRPFQVSNVTRVAMGKVLYDEKKYAQVTEILAAGLKEDLSVEQDRIAARYYLAALRQQGKDDEELYQRLHQVNPGEEIELQFLSAM